MSASDGRRRRGPADRAFPRLPRRRRRRRQDLRHARRGVAPLPARARTSWSASSRRTSGPTPLSRSATSRRCRASRWSTAGRHGRRWTSTPSCTTPRGGPHRRAGAHQRARFGTAREALGGRARDPRRRHRGHHDGQHPARRVARRRGRADHRGRRPRARPGLGGAPGRPARADRLLGRPAPPPHAARQHLPRATRCRRRSTGSSGPRTWWRCASSRCASSPTRPRRSCSSTCARKGQAASCGRRPSGSWWR